MEKQHGKLQRLLAVWLSLMMALVLLAPSAFADGEDDGTTQSGGTATITINHPETDVNWEGMVVSAYQVLEQVNENETDANKKQYKVTENFEPFFSISDEDKALFDGTKDYEILVTYDTENNCLSFDKQVTGTDDQTAGIVISNAALDLTYPEADLISRIQGGTDSADDLATFYSWIEKYIEAKKEATGNDDWGTPATATAGEGNTLQLTNLDKGYYALLFSGTPDGLSIKQGILIATGSEMTLKAEEITLTKEVQPADEAADYDESTTIEQGEQLRYKITTKVPTLVDYSNLTEYVLTDTLSHQFFTEDPATFSLQIGSTTATETPAEAVSGNYYQFTLGGETIATLSVSEYDADQEKPDTQTFTLTFVPEVLAKYQGQEVVFTYQAALTGDAVTIDGVPNDVKLNYTNGPDRHELHDQTLVYTYGIDVQKQFSDGRTTDQAVTFNLFRADAAGNKTGSAVSLVGNDGVYHVPGIDDTQASAQVSALQLSNEGKLIITGLDAGTYWLEETNAPDGFTVSDPIKIVLVATTDTTTGAVTGDLDQANTKAYLAPKNADPDEIDVTFGTNTVNAVSLAGFIVFNQKGFNLPQTGGAGTWMFTVGGIVLIAAAGALFLASRKKRSSK